jgi:uncharacterized delta-60 repeat protein
MAGKISQRFISLARIGVVAGLLAVGLFTANESVNALSLEPSGTPIDVTPPIVPEGQDGELDHSFGANDGDGINGFTLTNADLQINFFGLLFSLFLEHGVMQQTDGKILRLTTQANDDEETNFLDDIFPNSIQRLNYDGTIDNSFAQDGILLGSDLTGFPTILSDLSLQKDGKILITGRAVSESSPAASLDISGNQIKSLETQSGFLLRILSDGTLDRSFGNNGITQFDDLPLNNVSWGVEIMVQNDGRIILSATVEIDDQPQFILIRFNGNGQQDNTFADSGTFLDESGLNNPLNNNVFQQSDGKLVFIRQEAGDKVGDNDSFTTSAVRLTAGGFIDDSYGIDGVSTFLRNSTSIFFKATMQPDNQIVFSQTVGFGSGTSFGRISADGDSDPSFTTNTGQLIGDELASTQVFDVAIQPDGKIVTTGTKTSVGVTELVAYRFLFDGSIDETFGNGGVVTVEFGTILIGRRVIIQPNGQVLILGTAMNPTGIDLNLDTTDIALRLNSAKPVSVNGVTPSRLFDTRVGSPQGTIVVDKTTYGGSKELRVKVSGMSGLPEYGIGAVTINLTATDPDDTGYITVYPCGTRPLASNMNYVFDQTVSTSVTTAVSPTGEICVYSSAQTNLIADINSWSATNAGYAPLSPQRLVDTRARSPQGAITVVKKKYGTDSELRIKVAGAAGLPGARMSSVSLNVTVTEPETEGFITVYPCGTRPLASHLNFVADQTISASVTSPVSADGEICIYSSSPTNLIADTFGWFVQGSGITPVGPTRLVDTRSASPQGAISVTQKKYGATDELRLPLNNVAGLPDDGIGTVQLTVTATNPSDTGFITVYPCGTLPLASHLNYTTGQTIAASVTTQVSADGEICVHSNQPTNIIIDINGWGNQTQPQYQCNNIATLPEQNNTAVC